MEEIDALLYLSRRQAGYINARLKRGGKQESRGVEVN